MRLFVPALLALGVTLAATSRPAAAEFDPKAQAEIVAPFIDEQTVAVIHVDVTRIDVDALFAEFFKLVPEAKELPGSHAERARSEVNKALQAVLAAGGKNLYYVVSLADFDTRLHPGPFFLIPADEKTDDEKLAALLGGSPFLSASRKEACHERLGNVLFLGGQRTLDRLKQQKPNERPELADALRAAGDSAVQALLLPPRYTRRVIEEMMPRLPEQIGAPPSTVLTEGCLWAAAGVHLPPKLKLRLVVQSQDARTAKALREVLTKAMQAIGGLREVQELIPQWDQLVPLLTPQVQGDRLVLELAEGTPAYDSLIAVLTPMIAAARKGATRAAAANNLKQIALAMHNYHATHKSFPPAAGYGKDGKPLLSWRVHLLPFLEQKALYDQFHLDEPWDSEHNRKLTDKMPGVFKSPNSKLRQPGMTNYEVPVAENTTFPPGPTGIKIQDIVDGTSNTILCLEVDDDHAVVWTKPEDWSFDPERPARGLGHLQGNGFYAAFCDGSVRFLANKIDPETLRRLLIRDDGQPVEVK